MTWFVYILLCDEKTYYVGFTDNLERRIAQHKKQQSFFTKKFFQVELVYKEKFLTRSQAEKRERQLKKWSTAKKKALIDGNFSLLKQLSKGHEIDE